MRKELGQKLGCGCVVGSYLCPEAERLRRAQVKAYWKGQDTGDWREYEKARRRYYAHYGERPPF